MEQEQIIAQKTSVTKKVLLAGGVLVILFLTTAVIFFKYRNIATKNLKANISQEVDKKEQNKALKEPVVTENKKETDKPKITKIDIPKKQPPTLSQEAQVRRDELLTTLRKPPFFDEKSTYPKISSKEHCLPSSTQSSSRAFKGELRPSTGIYFGMDDEVVWLHGYDSNGGHTGPIMMEYGSQLIETREEGAMGVYSMNLGSIGYGLGVNENIDGRIEIAGKDFKFENFRITGDGNGCLITEMMLPVTSYSVYTLPMKSTGDMGPLSCDIDGDGSEDFQWSLAYPLLPQKQAELHALIKDMKSAESN